LAREADSALAVQLPLEIVNATPAVTHHDMDLDASPWKHGGNEEEYCMWMPAGEWGSKGISDLDVEDDE
jgi:hypothetical protein